MPLSTAPSWPPKKQLVTQTSTLETVLPSLSEFSWEVRKQCPAAPRYWVPPACQTKLAVQMKVAAWPLSSLRWISRYEPGPMPSAPLGVGGPEAAGTVCTFHPVTFRIARRADPDALAAGWGSSRVAASASPVPMATSRPPPALPAPRVTFVPHRRVGGLLIPSR